MVAGSIPAEDANQRINMNKIVFKIQDKDYGFLSNFYFAPFVDLVNVGWRTTEHYFQAQKARANQELYFKIHDAPTAKDAKYLGKTARLPSTWNRDKEDVMRTALRYKFEQNEDLRQKLIGTSGFELVEWAPWDEYWGAGRTGHGKNRLGYLLMELRDQL